MPWQQSKKAATHDATGTCAPSSAAASPSAIPGGILKKGPLKKRSHGRLFLRYQERTFELQSPQKKTSPAILRYRSHRRGKKAVEVELKPSTLFRLGDASNGEKKKLTIHNRADKKERLTVLASVPPAASFFGLT